jgi:hypothetical protein
MGIYRAWQELWPLWIFESPGKGLPSLIADGAGRDIFQLQESFILPRQSSFSTRYFKALLPTVLPAQALALH